MHPPLIIHPASKVSSQPLCVEAMTTASTASKNNNIPYFAPFVILNSNIIFIAKTLRLINSVMHCNAVCTLVPVVSVATLECTMGSKGD